MDLLQLQYFCTIAQYENITRAAQALFVSQPNLSTSLSRLEEDLGAKLFDRRRGKISLTPRGKLFLEYAQRALGELNAGVKAVQADAQAQGQLLRVVSTQTDFINDVLGAYEPAQLVRLKQITCSNHDVYDRVMADDADFGFYFGAPKGQVLEYIPMLSSERVILVHQDHPFAKARSVSAKDLEGQRLICNYCRDDGEFFPQLGREFGFTPHINFECDNTQLEAALVGSGHGISVSPLPNYYKFRRMDPALPIAMVRFREKVPTSDMGVVRRPGNRLTDAALFFLSKTAEFFRRDRDKSMAFIDREAQGEQFRINVSNEF